MAYSRLLLLLIGVISSVQASSTDFWCNRQARKIMEKKIDGLSKNMMTCVGSDTLTTAVQLPCVYLHSTEWAKKTLQQKRAEVVGAFQVFLDGVQATKNQSSSECQSSLWKELEHNITNYVTIVSGLHIQNGTVTPSPSAVQNCSSVNSTSEVLKQLRNLLRGKLDRLAVDLRDECPKRNIDNRR